MNPTTFNDPFQKAIIQRCGKAVWEKWKNAPLFEHALTIDEAIDKFSDKEDKEKKIEIVVPLPYPMLRVEVQVRFNKIGGEEIEKWLPVSCFVRILENGDWECFFRPKGLDQVKNTFVGTYTLETTNDALELVLDLFDNKTEKWIYETENEEERQIVKNLLELMDDNPENLKKKIDISEKELSLVRNDLVLKKLKLAGFQVWCVIRAFAEEAMMPSAHIALVRPNKEGKSVEWTKSRTHYTIIYHGHPANKKGLLENSRISSGDQKETIERMAHNRRAHWRTYTHARYRFAKGDRRFVKAAWVGPKEWQDEGGKQIYKILDEIKVV